MSDDGMYIPTNVRKFVWQRTEGGQHIITVTEGTDKDGKNFLILTNDSKIIPGGWKYYLRVLHDTHISSIRHFYLDKDTELLGGKVTSIPQNKIEKTALYKKVLNDILNNIKDSNERTKKGLLKLTIEDVLKRTEITDAIYNTILERYDDLDGYEGGKRRSKKTKKTKRSKRKTQRRR